MSRQTSPACTGLLAANLAALQAARPSLYALLKDLRLDGTYLVARGAGDALTVAFRRPDGKLRSLSSDVDPAVGLAQLLGPLQPAMRCGQPIALCGIGDGYLLAHLAHNPPRLSGKLEQPIYLIEPSLQAILATLSVHDLSDAIRQQRFHWFIGDAGGPAFQQHFLYDTMAPLPSVSVRQGLDGEKIAECVSGATAALGRLELDHRRQIATHYAALGRELLLEILGSEPPYKPRLLVLSSTCGQEAATDRAVAEWREDGFDVRVIQPTLPYQRLTRCAVRQSLADFRPDVLVHVDHQRADLADVVPEQLPFICWSRGNRPQAKSASTSPRDFVLADGLLRRADAQESSGSAGLGLRQQLRELLRQETGLTGRHGFAA